MRVVVNGETRSFDEAVPSVASLLDVLALPGGRVAVELNGRLIRRDERAKTPLTDGDAVEIVTLVGGG